jgi:ATP-binding protein involved in chromosome partitioning
MKIAVPVADGVLCPHFGHCEQFIVVNVDEANATVDGSQAHTPPPHEPGVLPRWLKELGVDVVIAGGMGGRAQGLFTQSGVKVVTGAPVLPAESLVKQYLDGSLSTGPNACDH